MIIERNISKFVIFNDETLEQTLKKISQNKFGAVFVLSSNGILEGIITDGDIRRWLLEAKTFDLALKAQMIMNKDFIALPQDTASAEITSYFTDRIRFIPLVDRQQRLTGIATERQTGIAIGDIIIAQDRPCFVIAEIGNNHNGNLALAKDLIDAAVEAGADCAKFQMRDLESMYHNKAANVASEDLGAEYTLDLLSRFQLRDDELFEAFDYCNEKGILPMCTPWDQASLQKLEAYGMLGYKVASADLTNLLLLENIAQTGKPMICSTGMSTDADITQAVNVLQRNAAQFVLLHCNSTYPAPFKDINLNYMTNLAKQSGGNPVGYSGHERGYAVAIAAVAMGAKVIEKHFTLDRNMEGNDHRVSLLPNEFGEMVQSIRDVEASLGSDQKRSVTQGEMMNREVLGKSVLAAVDIKAGQMIRAEDLQVRSPGRGLQPNRMHELIGTPARRDVSSGEFFYPSDVEESRVVARDYDFDRPFGIPVRYHDTAVMCSMSNFDMLEFHLSYKDMELDPADFLDPNGYDMDFAVHSPELFANDHIMDLCSSDPEYRARSIRELQEVVNITRRLKLYFKRCVRPIIIVNAGGFTLNDFMPIQERAKKYDMVADSIGQIDADGVEITFQTMPPFPWHFGGQRFHNLFMDGDEIAAFCTTHNMRVTLDISHSKLYCNHKKLSFSKYLDTVAPFAAHLHVVDAKNTDGEGLQIGDGDIDFFTCGKKLNEHCPNASFVPEIWQGHKNKGEGFWIALDRLEGSL